MYVYILAEIYSADKTNGGNRTTIYSRINNIFDLLVVHSLRQHQSNQCSVENGGCSNLCLALPGSNFNARSTTHVCACPTHYSLVNDTCVGKTRLKNIRETKNDLVYYSPNNVYDIQSTKFRCTIITRFC